MPRPLNSYTHQTDIPTNISITGLRYSTALTLASVCSTKQNTKKLVELGDAQLVKYSVLKLEDLSSGPSTYRKN